VGLLGELKRRKVTRVAAVYAVTAWVLLQIVDVVTDPLRLPEWFATVVFVLLALGFPIALIMAWAFEMTPEGIQRTSSDDDAGADARVTKPQVAAIVGLVVLASGWMIYALQRDDPRSPAADASTELSSDTEPSSERLHNSLAVLPFENLSPDPDNAYFAAGIHEETLNQLARIKDLSVIARTSVLQYAGAKRPIAEIAAELNVGAILEGSVRYAGDRVRITVQLIDAYKGIHLWSETYDRELIDIFQIETEIAASITKAMRAEFSVEERRRLSKTPTDVFDAYAHYLRAMAHIGRELTFQPVFEELRAAIDLDPNFADALAAMAYFYAASCMSSKLFGLETPFSKRQFLTAT
jgi:TolB-like protein